MPGVSIPPPPADGMEMPALRREQNLAVAIRALAVCPLWASAFSDGGNDFPGHADAPADLIPCDVVDDQSEAWDQRPRTAEGSGLGKLPGSFRALLGNIPET